MPGLCPGGLQTTHHQFVHPSPIHPSIPPTHRNHTSAYICICCAVGCWVDNWRVKQKKGTVLHGIHMLRDLASSKEHTMRSSKSTSKLAYRGSWNNSWSNFHVVCGFSLPRFLKILPRFQFWPRLPPAGSKCWFQIDIQNTMSTFQSRLLLNWILSCSQNPNSPPIIFQICDAIFSKRSGLLARTSVTPASSK